MSRRDESLIHIIRILFPNVSNYMIIYSGYQGTFLGINRFKASPKYSCLGMNSFIGGLAISLDINR